MRGFLVLSSDTSIKYDFSLEEENKIITITNANIKCYAFHDFFFLEISSISYGQWSG